MVAIEYDIENEEITSLRVEGETVLECAAALAVALTTTIQDAA